MPAIRAIDITPLERLLQLSGTAEAGALLAALVADLKTTQTGLEAAWNGPDFAALRAHAHVLIALAGTIGDTNLQSLAQQLNALAHTQNPGALNGMKSKTMSGLADLITVLLRLQPGAGA